MEFDTLKAMNGGLFPGLLTMMEVIALLTIFLAITAFAISLASIAWLCFEETRQPAVHRIKTSKAEELHTASALNATSNSSLLVNAPRSSVRTNFNSVS